jgi:hypothetical protein
MILRELGHHFFFHSIYTWWTLKKHGKRWRNCGDLHPRTREDQDRWETLELLIWALPRHELWLAGLSFFFKFPNQMIYSIANIIPSQDASDGRTHACTKYS